MNRIKKVLEHLMVDREAHNEYLIRMSYEYYYKKNLISKLDWMNDFYEESPNWHQNYDINTMESTIKWFHLNDSEKKQKLNNDLELYFNPTSDGEL